MLYNRLFAVNRKKLIVYLLFMCIAITLGIATTMASTNQNHGNNKSDGYPQIWTEQNSRVDDMINHKFITPEYKFSIEELNKQLYSEEFLIMNSSLRGQIIDYCSSNVLDNYKALLNCNTANRIDNSWYMAYWFSGAIIKMALSTPTAFLISLGTLFLFIFILQYICNLVAWFIRTSSINNNSDKSTDKILSSHLKHIIKKYQ